MDSCPDTVWKADTRQASEGKRARRQSFIGRSASIILVGQSEA